MRARLNPMHLISLPWGNMIIALGVLTICVGVVSRIVWPFVIPKVIRFPGPNTLNQQ
jgi:hypothetical protein